MEMKRRNVCIKFLQELSITFLLIVQEQLQHIASCNQKQMCIFSQVAHNIWFWWIQWIDHIIKEQNMNTTTTNNTTNNSLIKKN